MLAAIITLPESPPMFLSILFIHIISALWWPAFIELKYTWKNCFLMAAAAHGATIYLTYWTLTRLGISLFLVFPIILIIIQSWMVWISGYAWQVVKEPTLLLQYQRRESRNLIEV